MSDRKLAKAVQSLLRQIWRLHRSITKGFVAWLLRTALIANRRTRQPVAGFVLPTTVLLILVVALTTGALTYRAFNTSTRTIAETQNRVIYNAATPAIDRARSKIEFLFDSTKDTRYPGGVPSDGVLTSMLLNASPTAVTIKGDRALGSLTRAGGGNNGMGNSGDPYTLPDETRIDINGDNLLDNAWRFQTDTDGDGNPDATVAYSVILAIPPDLPNQPGRTRLIGLQDAQKANGLDIDGRRVSFTRSGPLSNTPATGGCATSGGAGSRVEGGWYEDDGNSSLLRKNFQVDAFVVSNNTGTTGASNFTTLELQQDRKLDRGNKWGAWFRNDMEIFPGPQFNWNGAMHTEGNLLIGNTSFSAYLISSPASCLFYESASEISVTSITEQRDGGGTVITPAFNGIVASGRINDTSYSGSSLIYLHAPNPTAAANKVTLSPTNDWSNGSANIFQISSDPVAIQVRDRRQSRAANPTNQPYLDAANTGNNNRFPRRFKAESSPAPYVDDTYRADNRYGPKSVYDAQAVVPRGRRIGQLIAAGDNVSTDPNETVLADPKLIAAEAETGADSSSVGLDGYWERRARNEGVRILVGERLELGNSNGWVTPKDQPAAQQDPAAVPPVPGANPDYSQLRNASYTVVTNASQADPDTSDNEGDPLYPPHGTTLTHEAQQRRALRDNLAAVQSTAVYHAAVSRDYPVACLASTTHPGTPFTLRQSINFVPTLFVNSTPAGIPNGDGGSGAGIVSQADTVLMTDFFNGRGTNGWEFEPPRQTQTQFETDISNPTSTLRIALQNLANFAGDHVSDTQTGAFPPTQEAGRVHPYPELTMWGNFSNLRRALAQLNSGTTYANLSPADKTYLQTAACTLGMLAYNIDRVQRFDPRNYFNDRSRPNAAQVMQNLATDLLLLMDGEVNEPSNPEVLPKQLLATYDYGRLTGSNNAFYNARDYDRVPAEAYLGKLREYYLTQGASSFNDAKLRTAELIFEYFQIQRDRTYGFRPSPAANTWNFNPYVTTQSLGGFTHLWSSACDPNIFALNSDAQARASGLAAANISPSIRPDLATFRMTLSRLCGTVIPVGGVHDYPGDYGLPQRNRNNRGLTPDPAIPPAYLEYIPREGTTLYGYRASETGSPTTFGNPANSILRTPPYNNGVYLQATVAPKWPSLFYLFPECEHDQLGLRATCNGISTTNGIIDLQGDRIGADNIDGDWSDDLDIRQPTGDLTNLDPSARLGEVLPAAFQPWAEPYITDAYIRNTVNPSPATVYQVVDSNLPSMFSASTYPSYTTANVIAATDTGSSPPRSLVYRYRVFNRALDDRPVSSVALRPRKLPAGFNNPFPLIDNPTWELPVLLANAAGNVPGENNQYRPPNRILVPGADPLRGVVAAIPFLDRVMFSGREWMPLRVMDMDIGLLRRTRPANQGGTGSSPEAYPSDSTAKSDVWLPVSGVVYGFREDAVREDGISRPAGAGATVTNATNPSAPVDPAFQQVYTDSTEPRISIKPVDGVADPDRRPHGFRLRDASQLARHAAMSIPDQDNIRGLSFFTDDPVFIMGDYNLHQNGTDDQATGQQRLEEFTATLPDNGNYTEAQFYNRTGRDTRFANAAQDRWRPSEILADAISVVSDTLCDGSLIDTFMTTGAGNNATISENTYSGRNRVDSNTAVTIPNGFRPYNRTYASSGTGGVSVYDNRTAGMFGPGCTLQGANGRTTFLNQNRPSTNTLLTQTDYAWMRENPADIFSPVKISRNGSGLTLPPLDNPPNPSPTTRYNPPSFATNNPATEPSKPRPQIPYTSNPVSGAFYNIGNGRSVQDAQDTRVNTIIVSGLVPSRQNQSYGGLHNFPRFVERWTRLWFSGSFLQLNFSNYATAPFDQQVWEPGVNPTANNETIPYYSPPQRLWGYDVALQLSPAGPAAARFVTPSRDRNEFYNEPPANDPYIRNLCRALPDTVIPDNRCPA